MTLTTMSFVLCAAFMHAAWNAIVKSADDKLVEMALVTAWAALFALPCLFILPLPAADSLPFLLASAVIHCGYFSMVALAYRTGDLSFAYPVMRGSAPLFTALISVAFLGEHIRPAGWAGVILLSGGILLLALEHWQPGRHQGHALWTGLANASIVVLYPVVDGTGVRLAGNPWSYIVWMFFLNGTALTGMVMLIRRRGISASLHLTWRNGAAGGALTLGSYGIALWAMTQAAIPLVAALRETSVIFGLVLAGFVLKERFGLRRWLASGLVAAGAATLKFG